MGDAELLVKYAASGSEDGFAELVRRYLALVHSTALRIVGNVHLAEEVTQVVFIILAKKANKMRKGTILSGWLYRTTRFAAARVLRSELRRARWENAAGQTAPAPAETEPMWTQLAPLLDDAMGRLSAQDRAASLLPDRAFEAKLITPAGRVTRIEISTDLRAWTPLVTYTNANRGLSFFDRDTDSPHRFYRARLVENP